MRRVVVALVVLICIVAGLTILRAQLSNPATKPAIKAGLKMLKAQFSKSAAAPAITSPPPGSTLGGETQQFTWSAAPGTSRYWLGVGNAPSGREIFDRDVGPALTVMATKLPTDGRTLHVTLWWLPEGGGSWNSTNYLYKAAPRPGPPPPPTEICGNGIDDDKDGQVDEGCPKLGAATTCGDGPPLTEHPRLWITCDGHRNPLSQVKARLAGPDRAAFQQWVKQTDSELAGYGATDGKALENLSVILVTYPVQGITYGHTESDYVLKAWALVDGVSQAGNASQDGIPVHSAMIAYDNLYSRLTAAQRTALVRAMQNSTCGRDGTSVFHHVDVLYRMRCAYRGLAYANDGIDDQEAKKRIASVDSVVDGPRGIRSGLNWLGTATQIEGWSYSQANQNGAGWHAWMNELMYEHAMDVERLGRGAYPAQENIGEFTLRMIDGYTTTAGGYQDQLAWNWRSAQTGPCWWDDGDGEYGGGSCVLDFATWLGSVKSRYAQTDIGALGEWAARIAGAAPTTGVIGQRYGAYRFMYHHPATPKSPGDLKLPLARRYDNIGVVFSRTGWEFGQSHTNVVIEGTPFVYDGNGYGQTARGNFTVSRTGPLIVNTSLGPHHGIGTISCGYNVPQFMKPGDTRYEAGCQRDNWKAGPAPNNRWDIYTPGSPWDMGGLQRNTSVTHLPGVNGRSDYVAMDLSRAYPSDTAKRLTQKWTFFRSADRTQSDFVVVHYDYEKTSGNIEARFPFFFPGHSTKSAKPIISGHTSTGTVPRGNHTHRAFIGANRVSLDWTDLGMTIRGWLSVLAPTSGQKIVEVGGPNGQGKWHQDDSHEWELPSGEQQGPKNGAGGETPHQWPWTSQYRADIIPDPSAMSGQVLIAIEVPPSSVSRPAAAVAQTTATTTCAHLSDKWSYCAKPSVGALGAGATFLFSEPGQRYARLVDLPPNASIVLAGGSNIGTVTDIGGANCGSGCRSTAEGTLELRVNVTARGTGAENTVTMK